MKVGNRLLWAGLSGLVLSNCGQYSSPAESDPQHEPASDIQQVGSPLLDTALTSGTVWSFALNQWSTADFGVAALSAYDPSNTNWFNPASRVKSTAAFGLPPVPGDNGTKKVLQFTAYTAQQGLRVLHGAAPNGSYGEDGVVSNYTLIFDVYYPAASDTQWRALLQTSLTNSNNADLFIQDQPSGGVGTATNYRGAVSPNAWHRIAISFAMSSGDRWKIQRFVDGKFVGAQNGDDDGWRWTLGAHFFLLTDDNGATAPGYLSSVAFVPHFMPFEDLQSLGGPNAEGALSPGAAAPAPALARRAARVIGHRGYAGKVPENTMLALEEAIASGAKAMEVDVHKTKDNLLVALHDDLLERTTDGSGDVSTRNFSQIENLEAGTWLDPSFEGVGIPKLTDLMEAAEGKIDLYLDIKVDDLASDVKNAADEAEFPATSLWVWPRDKNFEEGSDAADYVRLLPGIRVVFDEEVLLENYRSPTRLAALKASGLALFDIRAFDGQLDRQAVGAAKAAGFNVSAYTLMDPESLIAAANNGVDYLETDFIETARSLLPTPVSATASGPFPSNAAAQIDDPGFLSWRVGTGAVSHRVYFGTSNPPPLVGSQSHDTFVPPVLLPGLTYRWRVDEVDAQGNVVNGPVWSFSTKPLSVPVAGFWSFDNSSNLGQALVGSPLQVVGAIPSHAALKADDTGAELRGVITTVSGVANALKLVSNPMPPNGGSATFVNEYSILVDVFTPTGSRGVNRSILQTATPNANDADIVILGADDHIGSGYQLVNTNSSGTLSGITAATAGGMGFTPTAIDEARWTRLVVTVNLEPDEANTRIRTYLDGVLIHTHSGTSSRLALDSRYALNSSAVPSEPVWFFADGLNGAQNSTDNGSLCVGALALFGGVLSDADVAALGEAGSSFVER